MSNVPVQRDDQYYQDLIGVAAFGHLDEEDLAGFEAYLARNPAAQQELDDLRSMVGLLPLSLEEQAPSPALRDRLAAAVGADDGETTTPAPAVREIKRPGNLSWLSSSTGRALVAAAGVLIVAIAALALVFNLTGSDPETIEITTIPEGIDGTLTYDPDDNTLHFESDNMPAAPDQQVYQVWLIKGDQPESVGLMEGHEFEVEADREEYDAFAVTIEPGPSGSELPTTDPILVAPLAANEDGSDV